MAVGRTFDVVAFRKKLEAVVATTANGVPTVVQCRMNGIDAPAIAKQLMNAGYDAEAVMRMMRGI
jgi:MoaA/NifB/PqqE/SkfB family radical SAM enzyme